MKTAERTTARRKTVGPRAPARVRAEPAERPAPTLDLQAMEDLQRLTSRLIAAADQHARTQPVPGARDDFAALLTHELPLMERQLEHMARLFDDLAEVARLSERQIVLQQSRVLLEDVVCVALENARAELHDAGHELEVAIPSEPVFLHADLARLAQALGTLVGNSARCSIRNGLISISAWLEQAEVVITVRDNLDGVSRPVVERVFGMFPAADPDYRPTTGGLCIGLALVKGLVELHGGTVMVESAAPAEGTTYELRLPVLPG
jgi:signal transduction histidine kinase